MSRIAPVPDRLVLPFPDRAAHDARIFIEYIQVLLQAAQGIVHRVGELAHVIGLVVLVGLQSVVDLFRTGVHLADQVTLFRVAAVLPAFVMHIPGGIERLDHLVRLVEIRSPARFVAQAPDDD